MVSGPAPPDSELRTNNVQCQRQSFGISTLLNFLSDLCVLCVPRENPLVDLTKALVVVS
jgi:hypothetical protein